MTTGRIRSIVPMFGGATEYVETLDRIIDFVAVEVPDSAEFIEWHRREFNNVQSENSIQRRIRYLDNVGFLDFEGEKWTLGDEGMEYYRNRSLDTLLEIMSRRNLGLRSLLYSLTASPMTLEEIAEQQLSTHPELDFNPSNPDMPKQRANWLRSLGLAEKVDGRYQLTEEGRRFVEDEISKWSENHDIESENIDMDFSSATYETTVQARSVDPEFRDTVLAQYNSTCPISGVDHSSLLDVAHILSWSSYPEHRANLGNVLPMSKIHHAAFDQNIFTIDSNFQIKVNPEFQTESKVLRQTILEKHGSEIATQHEILDPELLSEHNHSLEWAF